MNFSALPALRDALEGGIFCGLTTDKEGLHFAVVLLPDRSDKRLKWKAAGEWATKVSGVLPTRPVSALLFANAKDHIEPDWYWTSETYDGSSAWDQHFYGGYHYGSHKSYEGRAVAVRLIQLTS